MSRTQSAAGLDRLFAPRGVAVVGASPRPGGVGHRLLANLLRDGYTGTLQAVHPTASEVLGVRAVPAVADLQDPVDLAVLAVPATAVPEVAEHCGRKGIKALLVVTAGFAEVEEGRAREAELRAILDRHGMRLVGPNCLGVLNPSPGVRLNATFAPDPVPFGSTAIATQSGALGIALLEEATRMGLGVSRFASMGNKLDVSGNDLLLLWENDPEVERILLYLESFGNPRNFVAVAGRVGRGKPILAVKSGRSALGARAAGSHTGALAQPDRIVEALFDQAGVLRVAGAEELFDAARALAAQPLPRGSRVAVLTNSGGPAILAVDAFAAAGLQLAQPSAETRARLAALLPKEAATANPVDMLAAAGPEHYRQVHSLLAADPGVDALLAIYTPVAADDAPVASALAAASRLAPGKPTLANLFGRADSDPGPAALRAAGVPCYRFPENAVRALGAMARLTQFRTRPAGEPLAAPVDRARAEGVLEAARAAGREWLLQEEAFAVLEAYGLRLPGWARARTAEEARKAAATLAAPFVLKAEAPGLVHKTEAGGVRLGLASPPAVGEAFAAMERDLARTGHALAGAIVMEQAPPAPEFLVGAKQEPGFGAVAAVAAGGVQAELWEDVALHLAPVTDAEAERMVDMLRAARLLKGFRGAPVGDLPALRDAVQRLAQLAHDLPAIAEVEANPVRVLPAGQGVVVLDARIRLAPASAG